MLSDRIDFVNPAHWDALAAQTVGGGLAMPVRTLLFGEGHERRTHPELHHDGSSDLRRHAEVVRAGEKYNVPTPVNKMLTETLMALTNKEIQMEEFAHKPEKLLAKLN